jgi:CheY-like chemotaxis protein
MIHQPPAPPVILVASEQAVVATVLTRYLRHLGYTVLEAGSGAHALALVRCSPAPIDLLLYDPGWPALGGGVLAAALAAEPCPPRMILIADRIVQASHWVDGQGRPIHVLRKPIDLDELEPLLRRLLPALLPEDTFELPLQGGRSPAGRSA